MSSVLVLSNNGQRYTPTKETSTNSAVPVLSKPEPNAAGPAFRARPINHYRKRLKTDNTNIGRAGVGMPMDTPGGTTYLGTTTCSDGTYVVKENITNDSNCVSCNPTKSASTKLDRAYYTDSRAYLRAKCKTYQQNIVIGNKKSGTENEYDATSCYDSDCTNKSIIYKPSNSGFATQGAVSSSARLLRLKVNTVTRNANSFSAYGQAAQNAGRYNGSSTAPYFLKSKENKCQPYRRLGKMTLCF